MADSAISGLSVSTTPSGSAVGVIADVGVDYKISLANLAKAGGAVVLGSTQQSGAASISSSYTSGASVYGPTSALIIGTITAGTLSRVVINDDGTNAVYAAVSGGGVILSASAGSKTATLNTSGNLLLSAGNFLTGSSVYGATSATINGALAIAGALTGVTTLTLSGAMTAASFTGSGSGLTAASIPLASLVTAPVTAVTGTGNVISSGGTTPAISLTATPSFTSVTLGTALAIGSGGTGSATQNFVDLTTNQTIGGTKTFSGTVNIPGTSITTGTLNIGTGGVQTGTLPLANGGTGAISLAASPFAVISPASAQTGTLNLSGAITGGSHVAGSSIIAPTLWTLSNNTTFATFDFGVTKTGLVTISQPLNVVGNFALQGTPRYSYMRNKIINGSMEIDQRNNGASLIIPASTLAYTTDRWLVFGTQASKVSAQQGSVAPNSGPPTSKCLTITSLSSYSVLASDEFFLQHRVEANNIQEFAFGTSGALPITLSFWINSSVAGNYCGSVSNTAVNRFFPFSFALAASTWTQIAVTIPGDVTGTWVLSGTGVGIAVNINLGTGTTLSGAANAWNSSTVAVTGAFGLVSTNTASMSITAVQLETGSTATPFEQRLYGTELSLCQRYCFLAGLQSYGGGNDSIYGPVYAQSATNAFAVIYFPTPMRALPTLTVLNLGTTNFQFNSVSAYYISAISINLGTSLNVLLTLTCTGLTPGAAGSLLSTAAGSGMIFSAEP
jgi:hypothetical protein